MQHRHEVVDVTFPAGDETTEVMQPGEEPFDLPAPPRATQAAAILRDVTTAVDVKATAGWVIRQGARTGDYEVVRRQP
jgi:hypothetical protein